MPSSGGSTIATHISALNDLAGSGGRRHHPANFRLDGLSFVSMMPPEMNKLS